MDITCTRHGINSSDRKCESLQLSRFSNSTSLIMRGFSIVVIKVSFKFLQTYWFVTQKKTHGVKPLVIKDNEVLLVMHTYGSKIWKLSGGRMEKNEEVFDAGIRELKEELNLNINNFEYVQGTYQGKGRKKNSTQFVPVTIDWEWGRPQLSPEIEKAEFFKIDNLPENIQYGVRRRIEEYKNREKELINKTW